MTCCHAGLPSNDASAPSTNGLWLVDRVPVTKSITFYLRSVKTSMHIRSLKNSISFTPFLKLLGRETDELIPHLNWLIDWLIYFIDTQGIQYAIVHSIQLHVLLSRFTRALSQMLRYYNYSNLIIIFVYFQRSWIQFFRRSFNSDHCGSGRQYTWRQFASVRQIRVCRLASRRGWAR